MVHSPLHDILTLLSLLPVLALSLRPGHANDRLFKLGGLAALIGYAGQVGELIAGPWMTDLATAIWTSSAAVLFIYAGLCLWNRDAWRLGILLFPFLFISGLFASLLKGQGKPLLGGAPAAWLDLHILVSVLTYAVLTLAATAALAVFIQERALKHKRPTGLSRHLPSVVGAESLAGRLLLAGQGILAGGLLSGMAVNFFETGQLLRFDHKTALSLVAFALLGALLIGHRVCGVRGRVAARVVLIAYLLVALAYPGVKFVTQILRGAA